MGCSQAQTLTNLTNRLIKAFVNASPEHLRSLSRGQLQRLSDAVQKVIPQTTDDPEDEEPISNLPRTPAHRLFQVLKKNFPDILTFLKKNVEQTLHVGSRQSGEDPRIDDASRTISTDNSDKLRSNLGCWFLNKDHEEFLIGRNRETGSTTKYAENAEIKDIQKLKKAVHTGGRIQAAITGYEEALATYYVDCGSSNKVESDGSGMIVILVFCNWVHTSIEEMTSFGRLCGSDESVIELFTLIKQEEFVISCLKLYPQLVNERRERQLTLEKRTSTSNTNPGKPKKRGRPPTNVTHTNPQKSKKRGHSTTNVTHTNPRKSKKRCCSTTILKDVTNTEFVSAEKDFTDPQVSSASTDSIDTSETATYSPTENTESVTGEQDIATSQYRSQGTDDAVASEVEPHWHRGRDSDQLLDSTQADHNMPVDGTQADYGNIPADSALFDLTNMSENSALMGSETMPGNNALMGFGNIPGDNALFYLTNMPGDSVRNEVVQTNNYETQLSVPNCGATHFPILKNVDYDSILPQLTTSRNGPTQSSVMSSSCLEHPSLHTVCVS